MVTIVGMQIYLNFDLDESYTPTMIRFAAGTGYHDLQEFSVMRFEQPKGWIPVDWEGVGIIGEDPDEPLPPLRCMLVQIRICENHQNGKDTHLRGFQIFAQDAGKSVVERVGVDPPVVREGGADESSTTKKKNRKTWDMDDWMEAPVLR
jgi:anaphase-promoting complex subunit 10